uniref:Anoctamin n=1 Tax=Caenorhabditis tropicalis TaxID=1561998 RepID=A0A1I7TYC5_9PELO
MNTWQLETWRNIENFFIVYETSRFEEMIQYIILGYLIFEILRLSQRPDVTAVKFAAPPPEQPSQQMAPPPAQVAPQEAPKPVETTVKSG